MAYDCSGNSSKIISKSSVYNGPAVKTHFFFFTQAALLLTCPLYMCLSCFQLLLLLVISPQISRNILVVLGFSAYAMSEVLASESLEHSLVFVHADCSKDG